MSLTDLLIVQAGQQPSTDAWGTSVAPTVKLMGVTNFRFTPGEEAQVFDDMRGTRAPGYEAQMARRAAEAQLDALACYEDVSYFIDALCGVETASTDVSGYATRDWAAPLRVYDTDTSGAPRIQTLVLGDPEVSVTSTDAWGMPGATLQSFTMSGETGGPLSVSASFLGKQVEADALADLADRDVTFMMGDHVTVYIDPSTDAAGTTALSATAFAFNLDVNSNRALKYHFGALTPDNYRDAKWNGTLNLTLEFNATTIPYYASLLGAAAPFQRVVRVKATSGSHIFWFDFNGIQQSAPSIVTDRDGVVTLELSLVGLYHSTLANWLKFHSVTNVEALA